MNKSSNIKNATYDPDNRRLTIEFHAGRTYEYDNVPEIYHTGLQKAGSPGTFFSAQIKPRFTGRQIRHEG